MVPIRRLEEAFVRENVCNSVVELMVVMTSDLVGTEIEEIGRITLTYVSLFSPKNYAKGISAYVTSGLIVNSGETEKILKNGC